MKTLLFMVILIFLATGLYAQDSIIYPSPFQQQQQLQQQQRLDGMNLRQIRPETTTQQQEVDRQREMLNEQYKLDEKKKINQQHEKKYW